MLCQTQWRVGFSGATGLDYNAVFKVADTLGIKVNEHVLRGVNAVESMMLERWHEEGEKRRKKHKVKE